MPPLNRAPQPGWPSLFLTAVAAGLVWALAQWILVPNLDAYHDMLESYAWSQTFEWGTFKHPPLFAWVTGLWFSVVPRGDLSFNLLAYTNVAVGLLGVAALARSFGLGRHARAAIVLLCICLPYTTLAAKFNANTQLLSVWPWAAVALVGSLSQTGARGMVWSTALGLLAALAMLAKYYSGVLLLALFITALAHPLAARWFASLRPWWALAVTVAVLTPHALWLNESGFVLLGYALDQGGGSTNWRQVGRFALLPFAYWLPGWLLVTVAFARRVPPGSRLAMWFKAMFVAWRPQGLRDTVFWLAFGPWAISLGFGIAGIVELSSPWAIPIGFAFPLLWLRNLAQSAGAAPAGGALAAIGSPALHAALVVLVLGTACGLALVQARQGSPDTYRPTEAAAQAIAAGWQSRHRDLALGWSSGDWPETAMMAFYADPRIRALPYAPDSREAQVAPHRPWREQGGVLICPRGPVGKAVPVGSPTSDCELRARRWLADNGRPALVTEVVVRRNGWRFPLAQDWHYAVFDVLPDKPAARTKR